MAPMIDWTALASQGTFAVFFGILFVYTLKHFDDLHKESLAREERLLTIIDCYNGALEKLAEKLGIQVEPVPHVTKRK